MTAVVIPLQATEDQTVTVGLGGQNCTLHAYQRLYGYYLDLYVSNVLVRSGMLCLNLKKIVRDEYLGFVGDLYFSDTQGSEDPAWSGVGTRFILLYDPDL